MIESKLEMAKTFESHFVSVFHKKIPCFQNTVS